MATTGPALHGLSRDVTLAVLPRLYIEELVTELNRRNITGKHSLKQEFLVGVLTEVMTKEYHNLESDVFPPDDISEDGNSEFSPDAELAEQEQFQCQVLQENSQTLSRVCPSSDSGNRLSTEATTISHDDKKATGTNQDSYSKRDDMYSEAYPEANASFNSTLCSMISVSAVEDHTTESGVEGMATVPSATTQPTSRISQLDTDCSPKTKLDEDRTSNNERSWPKDPGIPRRNRQGTSQRINSKKSSRRNKKISSHTESTGSKKLGTRFFACKDCDYRTTRVSSLVQHTRIHTGEKPYKCTHCDYTAARSSSIKTHMVQHTGEKPYLCSDCGFQSAQKSHLVAHMRTHTGVKPYLCDECDFQTAQKSSLRRHKALHTGEKPLLCDLCGYRAREKRTFEAHQRKHTGEKPYACGYCDFKSAYKTSLGNHMKVHTDWKPLSFTCSDCSFKTAEKRLLVVHMRKHSGKKTYQCDQCDFQTAYSYSLQIHKVTHTGNKPYACDWCEYSAFQKGALVAHQRKHTGEKPYVCGDCDYKAAVKQHLTVHMKRHTDSKPLSCDQCGFMTTSDSKLVIHKGVHFVGDPSANDTNDQIYVLPDYARGQSSQNPTR